MQKRIQPAFAIGLVLILLLAGCSNESLQEKKMNTVTMIKVQEVPLSSVYDLSGTLAAKEQSPISFELGGKVDAINVDIGDTVKQGQVLATLDSADLKLKVNEAQQAVQQGTAGLAAAQASLTNATAIHSAAQTSVAAAEAQLEGAQAQQQGVLDGARNQEKEQARNAVSKAQAAYDQAKSAAKRANALFQNGVLTQQENEQAQTAFSTAKDTLNDTNEQLSLVLEGASSSDRAGAAAAVKQAGVGVNSAQASVKQANASIEQANASVQQAHASYNKAIITLEQAKLALSKSTLKSEVSGVVLEKNISTGQMVAGGNPAFLIGEINQLKVLLPVPDEQIDEWRNGQQVSLNLYDQQRTGKVIKIYPKTNDNTGTISVEVQISNPNLDWKPGQVVKASRYVQSQKGIMIPVEAVVSVDDSPYVFKNIGGKAVKTPVKTGDLLNNQIVITSGLKPGDMIVTSGADQLFDGDQVEVHSQEDAQTEPQEDSSK
ncbi:efflux RND transporter periplasmic adaptor subunit [Paenibacillus kribbensis]|uniref:efflux RND transporter periplasmic adaptor subunit n=1 Tax=Paenibacillus kribbensis TaxID=172713 RepID=UPI002DB70218|nr:efflux RND transporter periplasmic adaptor subunit [Paenibacillus kribbensis]MEC0234176.1 efflux RND transporter periplasmic adaptor subunit [Paenibacillus kribbensis]